MQLKEGQFSQFAIKGFVKLKKIKNPRKTRIGQTAPTHPPIQLKKKLETIGKMKTTQKTQHFQKKIKIRVGT